MSKPKSGNKLTADLAVILGLLLLAGILYLLLNVNRPEGGVAVVRVNGVVTERHPLNVDGTFPLNGGSNILVIRDGQAWLSEADCPDKLCEKTGEIRLPGESIACVPNRVAVTLKRQGAFADYDMVAY